MSNMATSANITDSLAEHFNTLPMSETSRKELLECLDDISKNHRDLYVNITDAVQYAQTAKNRLHVNDIISYGIQFTSMINTIFQNVLPDNVRIIINVVLPICQLLFQKTETNPNIFTKCFDGLRQIMDDDVRHKCEGIKNKILGDVAYLTGIPPANKLSKEDRTVVMCCLGPNLIGEGSVQLGFIISKIKDIVRERRTDKFDVFLKYMELYCSLTTLHELLLLYQFAVLSAYSAPNANPVKNVLDQHRETDKSLFKDIRFLLKPRKETLRMHLKYNAHSCAIIGRFLNKHELLEDPSRFYDKVLQIFPEKRRNATLSLDSFFGWKFICCNKITNIENTVFQFRRSSEGAGNSCSIQPLSLSNHHITTGNLLSWLNIADGEPSEKGKWRLVELEPDAPDQPSSFVIVLDSTEDQCIYTDDMGIVKSKRLIDNDSGFYWTLNVL
ncbi:hypothetical protein CHS0354_041184 [Potamilus streckersoni]|uniref:Uncharacterized protein n=1 Tax=Potamilus streckersoni TaxID=2493646 RepID=A0AAE0SEA8_9BIVA|nr:hypothetical protein CHS0354_041184 [Potamilus streckersoni]